MRKLLLPLAASVVLLSAAAFAQDTTKGPATTGPAAQGNNMTKGEPATGDTSMKMTKKSKKMKKAKKM
jgi:hypothetical protein